MDKSAGTIPRTVPLVIYLLKGQYIQRWQWFRLDTDVLFVERARVQQPCCCVISVNVVGIWHVFDHHWLLFQLEVGFVLDARNYHQVGMDDSCGKVCYIYDISCSSCAELIYHHQEV